MTDALTTQGALAAYMQERPGEDVAIADLFRELLFATEHPPLSATQAFEELDTRAMQQRLGPYITRINRHLPEGHQIGPGEARGTYRYTTPETDEG